MVSHQDRVLEVKCAWVEQEGRVSEWREKSILEGELVRALEPG